MKRTVKLSSHYTIKLRAILGAGRSDAKEVRILNRKVRWQTDGERSWIEFEPDPGHTGLIVKSLHQENAKGVTTPPVKKRLEEVLATFPKLDASQTRLHRRKVLRTAFLSHDRPESSMINLKKSWTVFEETSTTSSNFRRPDAHWKRCAFECVC